MRQLRSRSIRRGRSGHHLRAIACWLQGRSDSADGSRSHPVRCGRNVLAPAGDCLGVVVRCDRLPAESSASLSASERQLRVSAGAAAAHRIATRFVRGADGRRQPFDRGLASAVAFRPWARLLGVGNIPGDERRAIFVRQVFGFRNTRCAGGSRQFLGQVDVARFQRFAGGRQVGLRLLLGRCLARRWLRDRCALRRLPSTGIVRRRDGHRSIGTDVPNASRGVDGIGAFAAAPARRLERILFARGLRDRIRSVRSAICPHRRQCHWNSIVRCVSAAQTDCRALRAWRRTLALATHGAKRAGRAIRRSGEAWRGRASVRHCDCERRTDPVWRSLLSFHCERTAR